MVARLLQFIYKIFYVNLYEYSVCLWLLQMGGLSSNDITNILTDGDVSNIEQSEEEFEDELESAPIGQIIPSHCGVFLDLPHLVLINDGIEAPIDNIEEVLLIPEDGETFRSNSVSESFQKRCDKIIWLYQDKDYLLLQTKCDNFFPDPPLVESLLSYLMEFFVTI